MCGRYVSISTPEQLATYFEVDEVRTEGLPQRYNVAPTLDVYAIIERDQRRRLGTLRWGLVPFWSKDPRKGPSPINARIETLDSKPMFQRPFERHRCVLPADGFYEWRRREDGPKQPYYIHDPEGQPLAFAGIWSSWRDPDDEDAEPLFTCAIVTTEARGPLADLHDRMPVMLPSQLWREWLSADPDEAAHLREAVAHLGAPRIEAYAITDRVNNVRNEGPELLEPGTTG